MDIIFQNYHKHTYWSNIKVADSATSIEEYCKRAKELGHGIISSVEHGWQGHYIECHQLAEKYGLKFVFGTEAYWVKDRLALDENGHKDGKNCHIVIIAKNENGRQAINDILSQAAIDGYYRQSRIDLPLILSLPADDVVVTSACFLKGNRVLTNNGYVNIEDIKRGDKVVNRYGQLEDVNFPTTIMYNGIGYSISTNAFSKEIKCTADHKYLVINRGEIKKGKTPYWCKAEDIYKAQSLSNQMHKFLLYPLNKSFTNDYVISKSEFDSVYKPIINSRCVKQKLPDDITITPELMRFFGAFIGNGYISVFHKNDRVGISFNSKEFETCYNDFVHPVEQQLGIKFNIIRSGNCNKVEISTGSIDVVNLFYWLFGNCKAESKHIPHRLLHISYELDCELLYGLCISDGCFQKTSGKDYVNESYRMTYCTTSEKLKEDFRSLCCDLGLYSTIYSKKEYTDKKGVFHKSSYFISIISKNFEKIKRGNSVSHSTVVSTIKNLYENTYRSPRATFDGIEYLLLKITSMNEIMINEEVYCLNNNTHSFVCEFATVHNCIAFWAYEDSEDIIKQLSNRFKDNFYLEVQYHNTDPQKAINKKILSYRKKYGIQLMMGCDSHYIDEKGALDRDEFIKSKGMEYPDEEGWYMDYPDGNTAYKRFADQCVLSHDEIMEAINNTNVFLEVEEYDCPIFNHDIKMPTLYPSLTQQERDDKLEKLIWDKWSEYKKEVPTERHSEYEEQIRYELDIVKTTFHSDYFLLDYAIAELGKKKGGQLTLTSRGSAPSFFITKLLGFTSIDRISAKVKMYPERFMSPTRILETHSLADIDMNVARQEPFWEAQEELLGFEHSKQMVAFQQLKPSAAWKMYAKAQNIDFDTANEVSNQIKKYLKALKDADEDEEIDVLDYIDEQYKDIYLKSTDYLGVVSSVSPHPCASCLYEGNIRKEIGYIYVKSQSNDGMLCCCMDGKWAEKYGFLKNDWLKVNVVEVIYKIFERIGMKPFSSTELIKKCEGDDKVWNLYKQQCTKGLNQVEQPSSSTKVGAYAPTNISELTAFVAAVRPGFKSMYDIFESREHFDYQIPAFDNLLQTEEMPNSFVLYQEQAMLTLNYAGIPMSECYAVIKAIAKKREEEVKKNKDIFIQGFSAKLIEDEGVSDVKAEETAHQVWQIIEDGSRYSFNCVAGTTRLFRDKSRTDYVPTIEEMYRIKHDLDFAKQTNHIPLHSKYLRTYGTCHSLCDNNTKVKKNDIVDIYYMGEKQTYRVTTKSGCVIECTEDHKFPTPFGNKELNELKVGDKLYKKGLYEKCTTNYKFTDGNFENNFPKKGQCGFRKREDGDSVLYNKFRTICKTERRCCEDCGRKYSDDYRFEVHHEDFDRTNNSFDNYAWLCVSCHKKRHYANGRVKKSDKGYPVIEDEIISIEDAGVQSVYDIEMADPYHTFTIDNGLIVCNCSHAYSVAIDSLYEAWLKTYYPLEFYETYFNILNEKGDKDRLNKFKEEAEHYFHITFPPYRFRQDNRTITIDKEHNAINNALSSIKGYSNQVADALYECGKCCDTFIEVLEYLDDRSIKSAKLIPLIEIGYFSEFGNENALLKFIEYWDILKQGFAKQVAKDKADELLNSLLPYYAVGKNKDGSDSKSWRLITNEMPNLLADILKECLEIEQPTYADKMKWQQDVLGYIELTTCKKEDIKRVLILDVKPLIGQYSPDPWCYKVETRSIGTGKTAVLSVSDRTWNIDGELKPMDIIYVNSVSKNKKGYWYIDSYTLEER